MSESNYWLATIRAPQENKKDIQKIRSLSKSEFQEYTSWIKELNEYQKENFLYKILPLNHKDFHSKVEFYKSKYEINRKDGTSIYIDLNRHILNCLFSFRTYLDHTETRLKKKFGKKSKEIMSFKQLTSNCFDNYFSYRFLYKLRNYAQHCGLPTGSITFNENENGKNLRIEFSRDDLLEKYDSWGEHVKPDLEKQDPKFNLIPLLDELVNHMDLINKEMDVHLKKNIQRQAFQLFSLIDETQKKGSGEPIILKFIPEAKSSNMNIGWFPYEVITKVTGIKFN